MTLKNQRSHLTLTLILATLWPTFLTAAENLPNGGACYSKDEVTKISHAIVDLKNCETKAGLQKEFIEQKMSDFSAASGTRWWQEPTVVVGGVVVGFCVGATLTAVLMSAKK